MGRVRHYTTCPSCPALDVHVFSEQVPRALIVASKFFRIACGVHNDPDKRDTAPWHYVDDVLIQQHLDQSQRQYLVQGIVGHRRGGMSDTHAIEHGR